MNLEGLEKKMKEMLAGEDKEEDCSTRQEQCDKKTCL